MREFYENMRDQSEGVMVSRTENHIYPPHFHLSFEVMLVRKGGYDITLAGKKQSVEPGDVVLIDSYEIHSYDKRHKSLSESDDCVLVFPYRYLNKFNSMRENLSISEPIIRDGALCSELMEIADKYLSGGNHISEAGVDLFFAMLFDKIKYTELRKKDEPSLVRRILVYISENFRSDCSRRKIASSLGYADEHISRVFNRYVGMGISEYVNGVRLEYIERLRRSGDKRPTIELIYESGFKSQQTYYRVKQRKKEKK